MIVQVAFASRRGLPDRGRRRVVRAIALQACRGQPRRPLRGRLGGPQLRRPDQDEPDEEDEEGDVSARDNPAPQVRRKLEELVSASAHWDGRVVNLQVTETDKDTMTIRGLMSARTSPQAWDLRCEVREKMIGWLQETYPDALPRLRGQMSLDRTAGREAA